MANNKATQRHITNQAIQQRLRGPFYRDLARLRALCTVEGAVLKHGGKKFVVQRSRALETISRFI